MDQPTHHPPQLQPKIHQLNDPSSGTYIHMLVCPLTRHCAILDPVLDYNPTTPSISTYSADALLSLIRRHGYIVTRILETHGSSGRKTAAWYLRTRLRDSTGVAPRICMGGAVAGVRRMFARQFGLATTGWEKEFDEEFADREKFWVGELCFTVLKLPGRQSGHVGYLVGGNVFCGDALFRPGYGVDDDEMLRGVWGSLRKLCGLPEGFNVFTSQGGLGRDSQRVGKRRLEDHVCTTVGAVRLANERVLGMGEKEFVEAKRAEKDPTATSRKARFGLRSRAPGEKPAKEEAQEAGGKRFFSRMRGWKSATTENGEGE